MISTQKASLLKRASAFLLDAILMAILITGLAFLLALITNFDYYRERTKYWYSYYADKYDISFDLTQEEQKNLTPEEKEKYEQASIEMNANEDMVNAYTKTRDLTLIIISGSIILSVLILEFIIPLIFKDGQTIGKKIFSICLMKNNAVRVSAFQMFARSILGKGVIEMLIPSLLLVMAFYGIIGIYGTLIVIAFLIAELVLLFATKNKTMLHDILAVTIVVDKMSQQIFNTEQEMIDFKIKSHNEEVKNIKDY